MSLPDPGLWSDGRMSARDLADAERVLARHPFPPLPEEPMAARPHRSERQLEDELFSAAQTALSSRGEVLESDLIRAGYTARTVRKLSERVVDRLRRANPDPIEVAA